MPKLYEVNGRGIQRFLTKKPYDAIRRPVPQSVAVMFVVGAAFIVGLAVGLMF